jgi:periplasmic mercuric ion binding protein
MKANGVIKIALVVMLAMVFGLGLTAQNKGKLSEVKILTSAQCEQCKDRIERAMAIEKGVAKSNLDIPSKVLTVAYNPLRTNPDKIRKVVAAVGYDADNVPADPKGYAKLPSCCKKPSDPGPVNH